MGEAYRCYMNERHKISACVHGGDTLGYCALVRNSQAINRYRVDCAHFHVIRGTVCT